jgi:hypothetical protein
MRPLGGRNRPLPWPPPGYLQRACVARVSSAPQAIHASGHGSLTLCEALCEHFKDPSAYWAGASNDPQRPRRTQPKAGASPQTGPGAVRSPDAGTAGPADRGPGVAASGSAQGRLAAAGQVCYSTAACLVRHRFAAGKPEFSGHRLMIELG